jgi:hypothetical protein
MVEEGRAAPTIGPCDRRGDVERDRDLNWDTPARQKTSIYMSNEINK